ncbi:MAG: AraC family ligand binding domain-containing protein, partial [Oscillospiraceae bacterium]|nr:AraC family ligand binding domain-containing protein [Oscillospiraceae bacterium]
MKKQLRSAFTTRQYMLSEDYEIFYYSDTDFRSVGRHSHGYYEFYFFAEGSVEMRGDQRTVSLSPGDVLTVAPGTEHQAVVTDGSKPYRRFVLWMSKKYCRSLPESCRYLLDAADGEGILPQHFGPVEFNLVCGKLLNLLDEVHSDRFGREDRIAVGLLDLLLTLSRELYEQHHGKKADGTLYEAVSAYIDTHLDEDLSLDALAGRFYVSKYHISHLFKEKTGFSVHGYISKKRLAAAREALRAGAAAQQAA